jgi:hypothetical protein
MALGVETVGTEDPGTGGLHAGLAVGGENGNGHRAPPAKQAMAQPAGWAAARRCRWFWGESRRILKGLIKSMILIVQPN